MELRDKCNKPATRKAIFFGEVEVGEIRESDEENGSSRCHAILEVGSGFSVGLVQGHGGDPEGAVRNAFKRSRESAEKYLAGISQLEKMFNESNGWRRV